LPYDQQKDRAGCAQSCDSHREAQTWNVPIGTEEMKLRLARRLGERNEMCAQAPIVTGLIKGEVAIRPQP